MKTVKWNIILVIGFIVAVNSFSDMVVPDWDGEADTTSVYYSFPAPDNPIVPDTVDNIYGTVQPELVPGTASAGWTDPAVPWEVTRGDGTGAWNINPDGYLSLDIPIEDGSLANYEFELMIDMIAFVDITKLPEINVSGTVTEFEISDFWEQDGLNIGEWRRMVWTGIVQVEGTDSVSVSITGAPSWGSHIDRLAVYTHVIPEPAAISLILVASGLVLVVKRRMA